MSALGWYLRRAVPWTALLGRCAAAVVVAGMLDRWPSAAPVLLPALTACCAAGAAFCFDETSLPVVEVTPRGTRWRRTARLVVAALPLSVWTVAVLLRPGDLALERASWWLVGAAAVAAGVGLAGVASRRAVPTPGPPLAAAVVLAAIGPVVVTSFLGVESIYPVGDFAWSIRTVWLGVASVGLLACGLAVRPGVRR
jgi:hypothetical protein